MLPSGVPCCEFTTACFLRSPLERHQAFWLLCIIPVQVFVRHMPSFLSGRTPTSEMTRVHGKRQSVFPKWLDRFACPPATCGNYTHLSNTCRLFYILSNTWCRWLWVIFAIVMGIGVVSRRGFVCISLLMSDAGHLSMWLVDVHHLQ